MRMFSRLACCFLFFASACATAGITDGGSGPPGLSQGEDDRLPLRASCDGKLGVRGPLPPGLSQEQLDCESREIANIGQPDAIVDGELLAAFVIALEEVRTLVAANDGILNLSTRYVSFKRDQTEIKVRFNPKLYPAELVAPETIDPDFPCVENDSCYKFAGGSRYMIVVNRKTLEVTGVVEIASN